jgi:glycosyltransferase involved in cell wall biosynthesis
MTADRLKISAAIITFNEEDKIGDCLKSLLWTDEIIVVDSHSTDRTREIALKLGAKVIERDWPGHAEQKNFALEQCSHEWVISLDADERVSGELLDELRRLLADPGSYRLADGYSMPRKVFYIDRWIEHCGWYPAPKTRLARKSKSRWGGVNPHDSLQVDSRVGRLKGDIYHLSFDSIEDHFRTIDSFTRVGAAEAFKAGKRANILDITFRPLFTFVKMFFLKRGFLDGIPGFIACTLSGFHTFTKYRRLYELAEEGRETGSAG